MSLPEPAFTCTGRGSHDPAIPPPAYAELRPGGHGPTMPAVLRCPVCGLTRRLGYQMRQKLAKWLAESGRAEVDISEKPF